MTEILHNTASGNQLMEGNGAENTFITEKAEKRCFYTVSLDNPKCLKVICL